MFGCHLWRVLSFLTLWIAFGLMGSLVKNLYAWMFARFMCGALRDDEFKRTFEFHKQNETKLANCLTQVWK